MCALQLTASLEFAKLYLKEVWGKYLEHENKVVWIFSETTDI